MSKTLFTYDESAAASAGQSNFIKESGAYVITIEEAKVVKSQNGATFIEFSGESADGHLIQYLSVCINKKDGSPNAYGVNMIQAIMGCTEVKSISEKMLSTSQTIVPEFAGKRVGLLLQKILRTKQDGGDTYNFEIRIPFYPDTKQTIKERLESEDAKTIDTMLSTLKDKDERRHHPQYSGHPSQSIPPVDAYEDSIPF
ncbi:DUF669 domain-containing protein [Sodalis endosymbiont of Spalangia cameroni]|uniref:DUF669 domain-containing protein n=1 Tax=Sodalis praecaptivus TaxID=1239307 RepID=UPI0031F75140